MEAWVLSLMSSTRRCACTYLPPSPTRLPTSQLPLKLENVPHTFDDDPLALAMRSEGETERQSRCSKCSSPMSHTYWPSSYHSPSSLVSPLDTQYTYNTFFLHSTYDTVAKSLDLPSVSLDAPS